MTSQDIYLRLWSTNDGEKFAQSLINDFSISPFVRIWALLKLGKKREARASFKGLSVSTGDEFEEMLYKELYLFFNSSKLKPAEFRKCLLSIVKYFPYSIWGRITLARILETRECAYARDLYTAILELCPSNPHAIAGFIQTSIRLGDKDKASLMLRRIKNGHTLATLSVLRKAYWSTVLGIYRIMLGEMIGMRLILGGLIFIAGFFMPTTIAIPITFFAIGTALGVYFISDMLVSLFFFSHAILAVLIYFTGYGAKILFTFLEGL